MSLPQTEIVFCMKDMLKQFTNNIINQWLIPAENSNPAMLRMLRDYDVSPSRQLLPWSGEFIGKHLTSACEVYLISRDKELEKEIIRLVDYLAKIQQADGYIGPWRTENQLTGNSPNSHWEADFISKKLDPVPNWDTWDFYHLMLGFIYWHRISADRLPLQCAVKLADLLYNNFFKKGVKLSSIGTTETNLAPVHSIALLYQITGNEKYLKMAEAIVAEFQEKNAGNYLQLALLVKHFFEMPIPRWESLHPIMGLATLYHITKNEQYKKAFEQIWWSIAQTDCHNTGGFSSGESACGNPYDTRPIETCCTVAWMALSVEMLKLCENSLVADELERSFYNGGLGAISPSGRWCTYNTPMEGYRLSSLKDIAFQCRPGSPELNCCSVNAPRILGLISQWAVLVDESAVNINYYGNYSTDIKFNNKKICLLQEGNYLHDGYIKCTVIAAEKTEFSLKLRIPSWSSKTCIHANNVEYYPQAGNYFELKQEWQNETILEIQFDMSLYYWKGKKEKDGKASVYRGPLLLAYDLAHNKGNDILSFTQKELFESFKIINSTDTLILASCQNTYKNEILLCDFRSAGYYGTEYKTWFEIQGLENSPFTKSNPLRICSSQTLSIITKAK